MNPMHQVRKSQQLNNESNPRQFLTNEIDGGISSKSKWTILNDEDQKSIVGGHQDLGYRSFHKHDPSLKNIKKLSSSIEVKVNTEKLS